MRGADLRKLFRAALAQNQIFLMTFLILLNSLHTHLQLYEKNRLSKAHQHQYICQYSEQEFLKRDKKFLSVVYCHNRKMIRAVTKIHRTLTKHAYINIQKIVYYLFLQCLQHTQLVNPRLMRMLFSLAIEALESQTVLAAGMTLAYQVKHFPMS